MPTKLYNIYNFIHRKMAKNRKKI